MARQLLRQYPRRISKPPTNVTQKFNYLLVTDFEATCEREYILEPQEIIEFPCVAVSTKDWEVKNMFHQYVKPRVNPNLSVFCTDLTGIVQDMVENQPYFPEVFRMFREWLEKGQYFKNGNDSAFVTTGDWDFRVMLPNQCALDNIVVPEQMRQWINLKTSYYEASNYYPRSLKDMLLRLQIMGEGSLHSGIDDSLNMVKIIQALQKKYNHVFQINGKQTVNTNVAFATDLPQESRFTSKS